jgi:hypothetical protein
VAKDVKTKRKCCGSKPRCKRCPTVLHRLERSGHAKRTGKRTYVVLTLTPKALKAARAR